MRHRHGNWEQVEVMALIKCKHIEHVTQKELMDLIMCMVCAVMWWNKITDFFLKLIKNKMPNNGMMCKDKWNGINLDFKKLSN